MACRQGGNRGLPKTNKAQTRGETQPGEKGRHSAAARAAQGKGEKPAARATRETTREGEDGGREAQARPKRREHQNIAEKMQCKLLDEQTPKN